METIQSLLLGSVCCPSFTGVKECAQDAGSVHPHLGVHRQVVVGPHPFVELGHDCGGFRDSGVDLWFEYITAIKNTLLGYNGARKSRALVILMVGR